MSTTQNKTTFTITIAGLMELFKERGLVPKSWGMYSCELKNNTLTIVVQVPAAYHIDHNGVKAN